MSETIENLQRKIKQAGDLGAVVKTMKAITSSHIGQFQRAVSALDAYYKNILTGIQVYLRHHAPPVSNSEVSDHVLLIVFGSDQGLVGSFNHTVARFSLQTLQEAEPGKVIIWVVGERVKYLLEDAGYSIQRTFPVPGSIKAVTRLTDRLLTEIENLKKEDSLGTIYSVFNRPKNPEGYTPVIRKLLPFQDEWIKRTAHQPWPSNRLPQLISKTEEAFSTLFSEYLFTSLFRACAFSLASENKSRLKAMLRAEKNIEELRGQLYFEYHQLRQSSIDAELFDIVAGFTALNEEDK